MDDVAEVSSFNSVSSTGGAAPLSEGAESSAGFVFRKARF
jgi:hypothetical protein